MRALVRIRYGAHLYGTATPRSDLDVKTVHVPNAREILLGRARGSLSLPRPKALGEKNFAGEVEEESYSLQKYLALLAEGQTVAIDVLFAPRDSMLCEPAVEWAEIVANRHRLLTRKSSAFVGYCRQQANKYGIKGTRVAAARRVLGVLDAAVLHHGRRAKLADIADEAAALAATSEHVALVAIPQMGGTEIRYLEVCGRKLSCNATIAHARDVVAKVVGEYGHRALQAEGRQGVDWKALSHAVRIATQAIELLRTGRVTFPLPNAARLVAIKLGSVPYEQVSAEIDALLEVVQRETLASTLPAEPDTVWIDDFVAAVYARAIHASCE